MQHSGRSLDGLFSISMRHLILELGGCHHYRAPIFARFATTLQWIGLTAL
jgi:hypothetical protein